MNESADQNKGCFSFLFIFNTLLLVVMVLIRRYFAAAGYLERVQGPFNILTVMIALGVLASIIYVVILLKNEGLHAILRSLVVLTPGVISILVVGSMVSGLRESAAKVSLASCLQRISPGADLQKCDLRSADLAGVDLRGANLSAADLREADLSDADLQGANLSWVNLSGTNLSKANLNSANLSNAQMVSTNLGSAVLDQAIFDFVDPQDTKGLYGNTSVIASWKVPDTSELCSGEGSGFQFAAPYDPDSAGIHPIFYKVKRGLPANPPREWLAKDLRELELVLCGGESMVHLDTCSYQFGGEVQRWQHQFRAELFEARTGKIVTSFSYAGPAPQACPAVISSDQKYYGSGFAPEAFGSISSDILEGMDYWVLRP